MKSNRKVMLAAALVVAVVALAGVGYAAVGTKYTATTTNDDNTLKSTYLTLTQDGAGAYTSNFFDRLYFNSNNTASGVTSYTPVYDYAISGTSFVTTGSSLNLAKISNILTLDITPTNNDAQTVDMKVEVTNFTPVDGLTYKMVIATEASGVYTVVDQKDLLGDGTTASNVGWTFTSLPINQSAVKTYVVFLFVSGTISGTMDASAGFAPSTATTTATKSTFTFTVEATQPQVDP